MQELILVKPVKTQAILAVLLQECEKVQKVHFRVLVDLASCLLNLSIFSFNESQAQKTTNP